jgi:Conjugative transposon protein TcpC
MVRGPKSGNGAQSPVYYLGSTGLGLPRPRPPALGEAYPPTSDPMAVEPDPRTDEGWGGAGGRWLLWPLRVLLWAALLIIAFRGVTAIVFSHSSASPAAGSGSATAKPGQFPVALGEAFAAEFGRVYLNFNPQDQGLREQQLAEFVPASLAAAQPDLGWNGTGQLSLGSEQVAGIAVQSPQHAVVTLLALVNGQLMELGVPVAASDGSVVVDGDPAWLPAPAPIALPSPAPGRSDLAVQSQLMNELPAFFQAYASGDSAALNRFLAPGVRMTGLAGTVAYDSIAGLHVPPGGTTRQITVSVIWQLLSQGVPNGAKLQVTYSMSVVQQSGVKWYVKEISASTEAVGAQ